MSVDRLVLVLNASYEPINIVSARRAIKLVMKGAAYVELASPHVIRTLLGGIPVPSVVRLLVYRKMPRLNRSVFEEGHPAPRSAHLPILQPEPGAETPDAGSRRSALKRWCRDVGKSRRGLLCVQQPEGRQDAGGSGYGAHSEAGSNRNPCETPIDHRRRVSVGQISFLLSPGRAAERIQAPVF